MYEARAGFDKSRGKLRRKAQARGYAQVDGPSRRGLGDAPCRGWLPVVQLSPVILRLPVEKPCIPGCNPGAMRLARY